MGQQFEVVESGSRQGYSATFTGVVAAAAATDVVTLTGNAQRVIRVQKIVVLGTATAAAPQIVNVIKRTTANTGGTAAALTAVSRDGFRGPVSLATAQSYTANPTLGGTTNGGTVAVSVLNLTTATGAPVATVFDFSGTVMKPPTLRSSSDVLALNYNGGTQAGNALTGWIEWTEEAQDSTSF